MSEEQEQAARPAPEVYVADIILPNQTNNYNTMFGSEVMALMDKAAGIAALRCGECCAMRAAQITGAYCEY